MKTSAVGYDTIKKFEGLRLNSYQDQVGIWTIGFGATYFPNGERVREGQTINREYAEILLQRTVDTFASKIDHLVTSEVTQNQFDALVSFAFNVGVGNFTQSTLLKKVNENPNNPAIRLEFMKWTKGRKNGTLIHLPGLEKRRKQEADLYFKTA
jgi:lysozyme